MSYDNQLSDAQEERLKLLTEECAEVIQMAQKVMRFGYFSSHHDYNYVSNIALLTKELGDLKAAISLMVKNYDVDIRQLDQAESDKNERMRQFLRFPHNL